MAAEARQAGERSRGEEVEEGGREMTVNLAIVRQVVLRVGPTIAALLFMFPHWQVSVSMEVSGETRTVERDIGRGLIGLPPVQSTGSDAKLVPRINNVRRYTEVGAMLLLTFVLLLALDRRKPAEDTTQ
jgi:hypothetical protein